MRNFSGLRLATLLTALLLCSSATGFAQPTPEPATAAETEAATESEAPAAPGYDSDALSAQGFEAISGRGDEATIPGGRLMLAAYLTFLALLAGYGVRLAGRHAAIQSELANLRRLMEDVDDRLDALEPSSPVKDPA